ncbi:MAG: transporter associated domain-containing protein [Glaciecola sp.]|nr:transporter associated domain-containing protein [Glaciecola sp.]MDG1814629.1 transporter associated domain-containing protein [Glaciecola sp.]MDG2100328.1 transporter associated domain-containing protein [Glaciecola sp.]
MSDDNPHSTNGSAPKGWIDKIKDTFSPEPTNHEELVDVINEAELNDVINPQTREMIEGVIEVNKMKVRDIMIPRAQMITIDVNATAEQLIPQVIESAHSRFPVISEDKDHIEGILLAKDLLAYVFNQEAELVLKDILRDAVIVPESKRVDVLLKDFRQQRYHMAIVVDEYGGVSGLVTIEDILELIVGEIEDEHDADDQETDGIRPLNKLTYSVKALTQVSEFNTFFSTKFSEDEADTIAGIVLKGFGHMPETGDKITLEDIEFKVTNSDKRRIQQLKVTLPEERP